MLQMLVWRRAFIRLTCGMSAYRKNEQNQQNKNQCHEQYEAAAGGAGHGALTHTNCLDALFFAETFNLEKTSTERSLCANPHPSFPHSPIVEGQVVS